MRRTTKVNSAGSLELTINDEGDVRQLQAVDDAAGLTIVARVATKGLTTAHLARAVKAIERAAALLRAATKR
jgi:hypothetical protein